MNDSTQNTLSIKSQENRKVIRLKDLGTLQNGISKGKDYFGFGFPFVSYGNVYNDSIQLEHIKTLANSTVEDQKQYSVQEGDVFFTRTSETIDEIGISATALQTIANATFSGFVIRLRPIKRLIKKEYSKYFFKADINRQFLSREISLVTRASLSQNTLSNLAVILPSLYEQTEIATYLDAQTQAIDKKINLLERKIGFYQELRKSVIYETVTKGLDPKVKFKDSGIDWIGQIPQHWEVKRVKDVFSSLAGGTPSTKNSAYWVGTIPWIPSGKIQNNDVLEESVDEYISEDALKESSTKMAKSDSVLIALTGATCSNIGYLSFDTSINQSIVAVYPLNLKKTLARFYFYFLIAAREKIRTYMTGGAQGGINQEDVRFLQITYLPITEQQEIVNFLDIKLEIITRIITNIKTQITTLGELRKTLINDVVTAKIKVINN